MKKLSPISLPFTKMHGAGNDFIIIDAEDLLATASGQRLLNGWADLVPKLAKRLCNRHVAIGADGLVLALNLKNPELARFAKTLYAPQLAQCQLAWVYADSDGSLPQTCGNALRCLTLWAHEHNLIQDQAQVLTAVGPVSVLFHSADKIVVDLGAPKLLSGDIPFVGANGSQQIVKHDFNIADSRYPITCVNVGNPHCVIFQGEFMQTDRPQLPLSKEVSPDFFPKQLQDVARQIQADKRFPQSTNVEFVYVNAPNRAEVFVLERGAGATLACGSGACAALIAGVLEERLMRESTMVLPGGNLDVSWSIDDNHVRLTGPARVSFTGEFALSEVEA